MKKIFILGTLALVSVCAINLNGNSSITKLEQKDGVQGCTYGQCTATAKSTGERCRNCCQEGSSVCWSHR
jgi:hypothetical protein